MVGWRDSNAEEELGKALSYAHRRCHIKVSCPQDHEVKPPVSESRVNKCVRNILWFGTPRRSARRRVRRAEITRLWTERHRVRAEGVGRCVQVTSDTVTFLRRTRSITVWYRADRRARTYFKYSNWSKASYLFFLVSAVSLVSSSSGLSRTCPNCYRRRDHEDQRTF